MQTLIFTAQVAVTFSLTGGDEVELNESEQL